MAEQGLFRNRNRLTILASLIVLLGQGPGTAQEARRVEVAKCMSATGTILRREAEGKPWQVVKQGEALYTGDLLVGMAGAIVEARNGGVRLTFPSNLSGTAPLPILESAVTLRESKNADLALTLDRGRLDVTNQKAKGKARVDLRIRDEKTTAQAVLATPGTHFAVMLFGRWPAGARFAKTAKAEERPTLHTIVLVLRGELRLQTPTHQVLLHAPPGAAMIQWDSVTRADLSPERLDQIPAWAEDPSRSELVKEKKAVVEQLLQAAARGSVADALTEFVQADDANKRLLAVYAMGALDELPRLGQAVATTKHKDVLENAVLAMRHWIGRGAGQREKLYGGLTKDKNFSEIDARTVVQLLHDFDENQQSRPEIYDALIDFLDHEKLAVRALAYWHLSRLVPEGRKFKYDPLAATESRTQAAAQWRKLVPSGELPSKPSGK